MDDENIPEQTRSFLGLRKHPMKPHYHGHAVRTLFLIAGLVMMIGLPFFASLIRGGLVIALGGILLTAMYAGFTTEKHQLIIWGDVVLSILGSLSFEYTAIDLYYRDPVVTSYFLFNQSLAVIYFLALYFSVRTFRAILLKQVK